MKAILTDIRHDDAYYNEVMDKSCDYIPNIGDEIEIKEMHTHKDGFKMVWFDDGSTILRCFYAIKYKAI